MSRELPSLGYRKEGRKLRAVGVKKTKARPSAHLTAHMLLQRDTLVESLILTSILYLSPICGII